MKEHKYINASLKLNAENLFLDVPFKGNEEPIMTSNKQKGGEE